MPLVLVLSAAVLFACHTNTDGSNGGTNQDSTSNTQDSQESAPPPLALGAACDPAADLCGTGSACCTECCETTNTPVCTTTINDACPLPDLAADQARLQDGLVEQWQYFADDDCAIAEGCILTGGWRRLLEFDLTTPNYGTADLKFGDPTNNPLFHYSDCHQHYHFDGYAKYTLLDSGGNETAEGHKQAFCLEDFEPWTSDARAHARYNCNNQGISKGWADTYGGYLPCQWIDITDVPAGTYTVHAAVNFEGIIPELDYSNNTADATYTVVDPEDLPAVTEPCAAHTDGETRDCGWTDVGNYACTPGAPITSACSGGCDGTCAGDPVMRVCDGADNPCYSYLALGSDDDSCGTTNCPVVSVTCPAGGVVTVLTASWKSADGPATCDPVVE